MIETERLYLIPLTAHQLRLLMKNISALEKELNCGYRADPMEGAFLNMVKNQLESTEKDPGHALFHSLWFIVRKTDRVVVGTADFKGLPDADGNVEIGYGLAREFEHHGYMTETVQAMCRWGSRQERVSHIIAETERSNIPSQHILKRCGFSQYKQGDTLWWKL